MLHREIGEGIGQKLRRQGPRTPQHLRMITLRADGAECAISLLNLSSYGAAGLVEQPLAPGRTVTLVFEDEREVKGRVCWAREGRVGIQFHLRLPVAMLAGPLRGRLERERRVAVRRRVMILVNDQMRPALVHNISPNGMLVEAIAGFTPGQWLTVHCGESWMADAQVRWVQANRAGLRTAAPMSLDDFEEASGGAALAAASALPAFATPEHEAESH